MEEFIFLVKFQAKFGKVSVLKITSTLASQVVLLYKFMSTLEKSGNRLSWFYHQKNILGSPSILFIGKEIKQQSKSVVRNQQLHTYGKKKEDSSQRYQMAQRYPNGCRVKAGL